MAFLDLVGYRRMSENCSKKRTSAVGSRWCLCSGLMEIRLRLGDPEYTRSMFVHGEIGPWSYGPTWSLVVVLVLGVFVAVQGVL